MIDMKQTIKAKSDQLNSDDLIGSPITVKITKVSLLAGDQPISIHYEGDEGKPWKPCKSMRRVLVGVWGDDGNKYIGRSLTLYRDDAVIFGGAAVGGIRISHMSHIDKAITMSLTASKMSKKPFTVKPLKVADQPAATVATNATPEEAPQVADYVADIETAPGIEGLEFKYKTAYRLFHNSPDDLAKINAAKDKRKKQLTAPAADTQTSQAVTAIQNQTMQY